MQKKGWVYLGVLLTLLGWQCQGLQEAPLQVDVLVIGGGASGISAGLQAARSGVSALIVEESPWLGGMLTAAGVSATDGNHRLPSGIWGEFRQHLYDHYGGPDSVATGWVSFTQFEPHVGHEIWQEMAGAEPLLSVRHGYRVRALLKDEERVIGARFENAAGEQLEVKARITIEATELGDALPLAGASFLTGIDSPENPHDSRIQDLTYAAILKDFGPGADKTLPQPPEYDPSEYDCICKKVCADPDQTPYTCDQVLNYAMLPNGKYLINWPHNGNDYYVNPIPMTPAQRDSVYQKAKNRTLGLIYFLQTEGGYRHLGLAEDEYPTEDLLPFIPYHREARRVVGWEQLRVEDLIDPYAQASRPLYQQAIAVGDYPLDHHHKEKAVIPKEDFPPIPSFSVPYGSLVPREVEGLLVAEKSISVTHLVNGATRLQPCVILIGQAAGAAAALCVQEGIQPWEVNVRALQETLLAANCWLLPFIDIHPEEPFFSSVQRIGVLGAMEGHGVPYQWANQTWFYPDSAVTPAVLGAAMDKVVPQAKVPAFSKEVISRKDMLELIAPLLPATSREASTEDTPAWQYAASVLSDQAWFQEWDPSNEEMDLPLKRKELAWILDKVFDPFHPEEEGI